MTETYVICEQDFEFVMSKSFKMPASFTKAKLYVTIRDYVYSNQITIALNGVTLYNQWTTAQFSWNGDVTSALKQPPQDNGLGLATTIPFNRVKAWIEYETGAPPTGAPTISVTPTTVAWHEKITVSGTKFTPNTTGKLFLGIGGGQAFVWGVNFDAQGNFTFEIEIGDNVPVGQRDVRAEDSTGVSSNTVWITVTGAPPPTEGKGQIIDLTYPTTQQPTGAAIEIRGTGKNIGTATGTFYTRLYDRDTGTKLLEGTAKDVLAGQNFGFGFYTTMPAKPWNLKVTVER